MRADRLLSILLLLQSRGRMTARELATRLEVSERTIHRDMEALGAAGIPVVAERGTGGGWELLEEYRTNLTGLNPAEIQALALAGPARIMADLGLDKASDAAFLKLLAALPATRRFDAEFVRQRIYVDTGGWHPSGEAVPPTLRALQDAIWQGHRLQLTYGRDDGGTSERVVDPLGLVAKGNVWYLIAAVEGELRTYRVSRVQAARITGEPCVRPIGFDLAAYWEDSKARFVTNLPRYPAVVRVDAAILPRLRYGGWFARIEETGEAGPDGWIRVAIRFETEEEACSFVLGFGPQIEVLDPAALREKVLRAAERIVAVYRRD